MGIEDPGGGLAELAAVTDRAIRLVGFGQADKPFVGHMTLARVAPGTASLRLGDAYLRFDTAASGHLTISSITLFKSDLRGAEGPIYTPLEIAHPRRTDEGPARG